ncbi:fructose-bisphospatase [Cyclospora cayetanensis]|uniref:fructose-bisphosphatase n=1 Tax=Cyclospora cayetanensis TaxID=88456 RepID=A0A1D3CWX2_9EIME|nr:fructose-bisphospatase [Cyclospora cayetanensis]
MPERQTSRGEGGVKSPESVPGVAKCLSLNSRGSVVLPEDPHPGAPFECSVLPELGEFVLQHAAKLAQRGINVTELNSIFTSIKLAAKVVNRIITRQGTYGLDELSVKMPTEDVADLRPLAHRTFVDAIINRQGAAGLANIVDGNFTSCEGCEDKSLVVLVTPLDGTRQIDVNVSSGSLFSVYKRISPVGSPVTREDFLQAGEKQVCAGYVLYGSSTILVCTLGSGVQGFTLDPSLGTFYLSHPNIKMPERGTIYSVNGDFHRNMLKGGIYIYPPTFADPLPSVNMVFQCFPLAFIAEQAGGRASDGFTRIQLIEPVSFQDRIAFFCGSSHLVDVLNFYMAKNKLRDGGWCFQSPHNRS